MRCNNIIANIANYYILFFLFSFMPSTFLVLMPFVLEQGTCDFVVVTLMIHVMLVTSISGGYGQIDSGTRLLCIVLIYLYSKISLSFLNFALLLLLSYT